MATDMEGEHARGSVLCRSNLWFSRSVRVSTKLFGGRHRSPSRWFVHAGGGRVRVLHILHFV